MECCEEGNLDEYLPRISSPQETLRLALEAAEILAELLAHGYTHLDIKTTNFFIKKIEGVSHICLGDLQNVRLLKKEDGTPRIVTVACTYPPFEARGQRKVINSPNLDLWALGEVLHCLFLHRSLLMDERLTLFHKTSPEEFQRKAPLLARILEENLERSDNPIHRCIANLFSTNLQQRPRPSAASVAEIIRRELHTSAL